MLDGHVRPAGDAHHSVDVRHFRAERRERLEVRKNAQAVTRLGLALRRRGVARAALGERRAVDLQVAVFGLREVHPATVERPGHVVGLGVVDPGAALVLGRDVRGDAELGAQAPLARELGVARLRAAGEVPDADVDAVLGDTAVVGHRDEDAVRLVWIAPEGHVVEERVLDVDLGDDRGLLAVGRVIDDEPDVRVGRRHLRRRFGPALGVAGRVDEQVEVADRLDRLDPHALPRDAGHLAHHRRLGHVLHVEDQGRLVRDAAAGIEAVTDRRDAAAHAARKIEFRIQQLVLADQLEVLHLAARGDLLDRRAGLRAGVRRGSLGTRGDDEQREWRERQEP